ncbi:ABC transporter ATP-binding protein [Actinospica robiniae]|uniref:ABC-type multidrug transport system, ATPase and permease component n=1 Tax=Actinospica robiniae DSM 44927 TaxID=479430 RepID=W9E4H8_9ACTN|nr:ABC transporter ATP-binding protein [Actinospica robiniae]ETA71072.1 ABC-type multidrug transport system, ATPase and permease component [Actinospica robiniae DSM 44927]
MSQEPDYPRSRRGRARLLLLACADLAGAAPTALAVKLTTTLVGGASPVAVAWLTMVVVNRMVSDSGMRGLTLPLALLCLVGLVMAVAQYADRYADRELGRRATVRGMSRLFGAVLAPVGIGELEDPAYQDRVRLAQQSITSGITQLVHGLIGAAQPAITTAGYLVSLWTVSPEVTWLVLASSVPALIAQLRLSGRREAVQRAMSPLMRRQLFYSMLMLDARAGTEIRLFGLGPLLRRRLLNEVTAGQRKDRAVDRATVWTESGLALLTACVAAAALFGAADRITTGHAPVGSLALLLAALAGVQAALAGLLMQVTSLGPALALYEVYHGIVGAPPDDVAAAPTDPGPLRIGIEVRDVWFRYHADRDWVLRAADLTLPAGTSTALVGLNGAGKSTLVKLLCRMYEPERGVITWDGIDIRQLDPEALRRRVGVLFQDYMTYAMTAGENIGVGEVSTLEPGPPDLDRIRAAANAAGIDAELAALPEGYDTMLGRMFATPGTSSGPTQAVGASSAGAASVRRAAAPGPARPTPGTSLSGGQWQRVALARALLRRDADLLVLDEPSSGLDAVAEGQIHTRIGELRAGRTSLLISHRLAAVRGADQIVVLREGRIVERGDHESLMLADGVYAELFRTQAAGYQLTPADSSGGHR